MYQLQVENPKRGDWASTCRKNLEDLQINLSNEDMKKMSRNTFNNMIRRKCKEKAYEYLLQKRGKKGNEIQYKSLRMAEYLLPNEELTVENQREIFEIRNRMVNIPSNFKSEKESKETCICGEKETMEHLFYCKQINIEEKN